MTRIDLTSPGNFASNVSMPDGNPVGAATTNGTNPRTSNSTTTTDPRHFIDIEAQVLRDGMPLTRPTRYNHGLTSFEPGDVAAFKLFPGSVNRGEQVSVAIAHVGWVAPRWIQVQARLSIDGVPWPAMLPGQVYVSMDPLWQYGQWSCAINFPIMSHLDEYQGVHTLLLRTIME